ncbi:MAG: CdaR family protein [Anaerolineaceae bacterium]|jgi:YbbR domain-containing protein|nr:CdaR family protein [Anaerolineaceae bacterium]
MMDFLKRVFKLLPIFFTALILAVIVWVSSVSSSDPNEVVSYTTPVPLTVLGQNPDFLITEQSTSNLTITLRAPRSVHEQILRNFNQITAQINLSGLAAGTYDLVPEIDTANFNPVQVLEVNPAEVNITLEKMATKILDITLLQTGNLPISYEADEATLSSETVELLGPESIINEVNDVVASIDLSSTTTTITRTVELRPLDRRGNVIEGVSLNPASITVEVPIRQLVGYRNVFVKIVTTGTIAQGYHLTSLVVDPPSVTIYTSDPALAEEMPSFLDTAPINLSGAYEDFNINVELQLQDGIVVVGNPQVTVQVGIDAIQSSIQFVGVPVEIINLEVDLTVNISPDRVDLYISGPMNLLEELTADNIRVTLDLSDRSPGTYQLSPDVFLNDDELRLDSILPGTIEVVLWR